MFNNTYYHSLIRKHVIVFGTLFNDIYIQKDDGAGNVISTSKVPLTYSGKDKMLARVFQDPELNRNTAITLPRMAFEMTGMTYRSEDQINKIERLTRKDPSDSNKVKTVFSPVPYNFTFRLHIFVNSVVDGTQIIENILPNFTPSFTLNVELDDEMHWEQKIEILHNGSPTITDNYGTGTIKDKREIIWTLNFTVKGFLLGPIKSKPIIKFAKINYSVLDPDALPFQTIVVRPGLTANGQPTSNTLDSIPATQIFSDDDFGFIIEQDE